MQLFLFQVALIFKKSNEFKGCLQTTFEFLNRICLVKAILLGIGKPGTKIFDQLGKYFHKILYHRTTVSGDNTEKIWAHRFSAKPKTVTVGSLGGAGGPGRCLREGAGVKPLNNFVLFSHIKHAKTVIVKVNIG